MATANVSVQFEATDIADAEAKIATWTLHQGCTVIASITAAVPPTPGEADESGAVRAVEPPPEEPPPE